jgi:hypothetical protein
MEIQQMINAYARRTGTSPMRVKQGLKSKFYPNSNERNQTLMMQNLIKKGISIKESQVKLLCEELQATPNQIFGHPQHYMVIYEIFTPWNSKTLNMHQVVDSNEMVLAKVEELRAEYGAMLTYLKVWECGNEIKMK